MGQPTFFTPTEAMTVASVAAFLEGRVAGGDPDAAIAGVGSIDEAGPDQLTFLDHARYAPSLATTRARACLVAQKNLGLVPRGIAPIVVPNPHAGFVLVLRRFHPLALRPTSLFGATGVTPGAIVHPEARLEAGVVVDPGAMIGPGAEIGAGTLVASGAVIGPGVRVGRDCAIGAHVSLTHALVGNRVILHPGVRIGQDGFGFEGGAAGHLKIPQIGRVILQDDVEIGANTTVDRGALGDTVIGEGTKIDNLVQIAHNVRVGRHCVIVAQCGIAGSARLGDFVLIGAAVGINNRVVVGDGAQIAATSVVNDDVPAGARWGGWPAKPVREWFREVATLERLAKEGRGGSKDGEN